MKGDNKRCACGKPGIFKLGEQHFCPSCYVASKANNEVADPIVTWRIEYISVAELTA